MMQKSDSIGKHTLNVLFISLEKNLLDQKQGDALERHLRYAQYFNKLNVVVFTGKKDGFIKSVKKNNLLITPTNSANRWFYIWDAIKISNKLHKRDKLHIISSQDPFITALAAILIKFKTHSQLNIQIHNDYSSKYWKYENLQNWLFSLLLPITLSQADSIRAVSKLTSRIAPSQKNVYIAPIPVDLDFFRGDKKIAKQIDILSVGRLVKQKNLSLLLKSVSSLRSQFPKLRAVIVGEGPQEQSLKSQISNLKLQENVELFGAKDRNDIRKLMQKSKIFVLPSNYEGWGLVTVEAAACGLPVVMTDTGGAMEIVVNGKTGYIVPLNNPQTLKKKLAILLQNTRLREMMGQKGKIWVEKRFKAETLEKQWTEGLIAKAKKKSKVCFILPESDPETATHYPYTLKLFKEYAKTHPAALFVEKGKPLKESREFEKVVLQNLSTKPLNLIERLFLLSKLRLEGYTSFYIHYSYWSLFLLRLISLVLPTRIFYWHAEEFKKRDLEEMDFFERSLLMLAIIISPNLVTGGIKLKKTYINTFDLKNPKKIKVVPNWVEATKSKRNKTALRKKLNLPLNKKLIFYVHRLSQRKGAHLLPEVIAQVTDEVGDAYFVIIGSGPLEKSLKAQIEKKDASFLGDVPHSKIHDYYATADIFIMPSLREGFPRVILEAMAAGLPIVSSDVGEVKNILPEEQKKYVLRPEDIHGFSTAIVTLLKSSEKRAQLTNSNRLKVQVYNLKRANKNLTETLEDK